ncbi:MAG TPA: NACHT domain-containing protein [Cytophagales bacterium]|nr:NACHT domain-containing protein [Cytophagales bacterium]
MNTTGLLTAFKDQISQILSLTKDELKNFFDDGLHNYLEKQRIKFLSTKTFLFRIENVSFYNVFFPARLLRPNGLKSINYTSLINVDERYVDRCVISGEAGSGKTMLIKALFLESIKNVYKIPILIELRYMNDFDGGIIKYIKNIVLDNKIKPSDRILERVLERGGFLFLFDGYDELYSDKVKKITKEINDFVEKYSKNQYIITTRPGTSALYLDNFEVYSVLKLEKSEIRLFIEKQVNVIDDKMLGEKIINVINKTKNTDYAEYLSNPLLLSMFIFAFRVNPQIPKTKYKFYSNVFETLITQHDSINKKGGFQHERRSTLRNEDIEKVLKWLSFITFRKGKYSFQIDDLKDVLSVIKEKIQIDFSIEHLIYDLSISISILILDGIEYRFPHRSMQEYFSALLIRGFDDKTKQKIYSSFLQRKSRSYESLHNHWLLCKEMDQLAFSKFFLQTHLIAILEPIRNADKKSTILAFFDIFNIELSMSFGTADQEQDDSDDFLIFDDDIEIKDYRPIFTFPSDKGDFYLDFLFFAWKVYFEYNSNYHPIFFIMEELSHESIFKLINFKKHMNVFLDAGSAKITLDKNYIQTNINHILSNELGNNILFFYKKIEEIYQKVEQEISIEEDNLDFLVP